MLAHQWWQQNGRIERGGGAGTEDMQDVCAGEAVIDSHRTDVAPGGLLHSVTVWSGYGM